MAILATPLLAPLAGCATVSAPGATSGVYLGLVRVQSPPTTARTRATTVQSLGLGWADGPLLGWQDRTRIEMNPEDCQILVIVRSKADAEHARTVLDKLQGDRLCITDSAHP